MSPERFRVVPAAYVLLRRGDDVLLQRRANTGYYDDHWASGAAGHVEAGESVLECAVREAVEELAVVIDPRDLRFVSVLHRTLGSGRPDDERVDFFFECRAWAGEPVLAEPKASDLGWFPLTALPSPIVPHELRVLSELRSGTPSPLLTVGFHSVVDEGPN